MKVTITDAAPDEKGLRLGLRIEHEKAGWVRFAVTVLLVDRLHEDERRSLMTALDNTASLHAHGIDVPLF